MKPVFYKGQQITVYRKNGSVEGIGVVNEDCHDTDAKVLVHIKGDGATCLTLTDIELIKTESAQKPKSLVTK